MRVKEEMFLTALLTLAACSCMWLFMKLITHSSDDGHLGCFHILVIVNNDPVNTGVFIYFWISVFVFFGYIPWRDITGLHDSFIFNFLKAGEAGSCYWWRKLSQAEEFPLSTEQGQPVGWQWCRQNETILPIFYVWLFSIFCLHRVAECAAVQGVTKSWHNWATELSWVANAS